MGEGGGGDERMRIKREDRQDREGGRRRIGTAWTIPRTGARRVLAVVAVLKCTELFHSWVSRIGKARSVSAPLGGSSFEGSSDPLVRRRTANNRHSTTFV